MTRPMTDEEFVARFQKGDIVALVSAQAKAALTAARLLNPLADPADVADIAVNMLAMALRELVLNVVDTREDFLTTVEAIAREVQRPTDVLPARGAARPVRVAPV